MKITTLTIFAIDALASRPGAADNAGDTAGCPGQAVRRSIVQHVTQPNCASISAPRFSVTALASGEGNAPFRRYLDCTRYPDCNSVNQRTKLEICVARHDFGWKPRKTGRLGFVSPKIRRLQNHRWHRQRAAAGIVSGLPLASAAGCRYSMSRKTFCRMPP